MYIFYLEMVSVNLFLQVLPWYHNTINTKLLKTLFLLVYFSVYSYLVSFWLDYAHTLYKGHMYVGTNDWGSNMASLRQNNSHNSASSCDFTHSTHK